MSLHDQVQVAGITEACRYNDHGECRAPNCSCDCHRKVVTEAAEPSKHSNEPKEEKVCPKCGVKRPFSEVYCRLDGSRLSSLLCGVCGAGMEPGDLFCWRCSAPKGMTPTPNNFESGKAGRVETAQIDPELDVDYGEQVLSELQKELGHDGHDGQEGQQDKPQVVVEKPAGSQGSFSIVSKPSPNKIRGPVSSGGTGGVGRVTTPIKLPIKP